MAGVRVPSKEERAPDAPGDAVVEAGNGRIDDLAAWTGHGASIARPAC